MCHGLPKHSLIWMPLSGYVFDFAVEPLISHIRHEFHESGFLICPTSPKRFESRKGWKILQFQPDSGRCSLPAITPDPLAEQGMHECALQASMREGGWRKELFLCYIGRGLQYFCI